MTSTDFSPPDSQGRRLPHVTSGTPGIENNSQQILPSSSPPSPPTPASQPAFFSACLPPRLPPSYIAPTTTSPSIRGNGEHSDPPGRGAQCRVSSAPVGNFYRASYTRKHAGSNGREDDTMLATTLESGRGACSQCHSAQKCILETRLTNLCT